MSAPRSVAADAVWATRWGLREGASEWYTRRVLQRAGSDLAAGFARAWRRADLIPGWFSRLSAAALYTTVAALRPQRIVEVGSYLGRSTVFFATAVEVLGGEGRVTAIDPHTGDRQHLEALGVDQLPSLDLFRAHLDAAGVAERVDVVVGTSGDAVDGWSEPVDLCLVDGWHTHDAVVRDGTLWAQHLRAGGVIVFDDVAEYAEVATAVRHLHTNGVLHVWGNVFGQAYAGTDATPPEAVGRLLQLAGRRLAARLYREPAC